MTNPLRSLYHGVLRWADRPGGSWALAFVAFIDSSVFPIPPLFLQVALSIKRPDKSWFYALINSVASMAGAALGYVLGRFLYAAVGAWVIHVNGLDESFAEVGERLRQHGFPFILIGSFVPFPFAAITIGSGFYSRCVDLPTMLIASTIGRSSRFFLLAAITRFWGARAGPFIEKYFNGVMLGVALLAVTVLVAMRLILKR